MRKQIHQKFFKDKFETIAKTQKELRQKQIVHIYDFPLETD